MAVQPKSNQQDEAKSPREARKAPKKAKSRRAKVYRSKLSKLQIEEMFRRFQEIDPDPRSELEYSDPFTLLIAVVLSAQATDASVNKATPGLFAMADTPEKLAGLDVEQVIDKIKTIGLFRSKAKNIVALSRTLAENYGGVVPQDREALEALPGVGRKTANVVLNVAFGQPTLAVDTHIFRVSNRTGLAPGKTPLDVELCLEKVVPDRYKLHAHHWLILHGRYICKARKPECWRCAIADICLFKPKTPAPIAK
ncbi:Endonuclease III [Methyloligella halotolerans]|uniref:Endonuclease III n=1 Tax=Methyloligella halotolerans TaxID=1177755 RepID=A0A1E2S142_9HYPH|nr:endonuclease III [Methyloligella halotolerans]ODA68058.1 Endonuclease III [Methyloligella halotolerans]